MAVYLVPLQQEFDALPSLRGREAAAFRLRLAYVEEKALRAQAAENKAARLEDELRYLRGQKP